MPIALENRRRSLDSLRARHPDSLLLDVTSRGHQPWVKFSPFYPHGNIPVPLSPGYVAASVEGIWQGLKVFEKADIDRSKFDIGTMRGIKRSAAQFGSVLGHRDGVEGTALLPYREARYRIYLPAYKWVLDHIVQEEVRTLRELVQKQGVVLLDFETNADIENLAKPLSHAALIVRYVQHDWPVSPF